jgi:hypothetical protein
MDVIVLLLKLWWRVVVLIDPPSQMTFNILSKNLDMRRLVCLTQHSLLKYNDRRYKLVLW